MSIPESSYVSFEQLVAFCEGRLSGVAAEQVREKALHNPLIQETITNLRSQLHTDNSQNLQLMIDQSLDQFLTQTFARSFQSNQETSNRGLWPNSAQPLLRGGQTRRRQVLLLAILVLMILLAYLFCQSRVFSGETNESGPVANVPALLLPVDSLSTHTAENNDVFDAEESSPNESLGFSAETKATDAVANASNLAFPDSFTAQADGEGDLLGADLIQKQESLGLSDKMKASTLSTKADIISLLDTTSADAAGKDEALNAVETDSLLAEAKTTASMGNGPTLVFPDGFTPNGDGLNDVFQPKLLKKISIFHEFTIYDRWGELAYKATNFSTKSAKKGWDGTINGRAAPEATYVYLVRLRTALGVEETFTGNVRLMR